MAGTSTASAALAVSDALRAAAVQVFNDPSVLVCEGSPSNGFPDDIVSFGRISTAQDPATLGSTRSRNEQVSIDVLFSIYRRGNGKHETAVKHRAWGLFNLLEQYLRRTDPTLGGVCNWCFPTGTVGESNELPPQIAEGRLYELTVTFSAFVRITG